MKQRHGAVEQAFRPERKTSLRSPLEQHGPPMTKEQQSCRDGVQQASLSDEHCERNRFPSQIRLIILQGKGLKKKKTSKSAIEKKGGYTKRAIKEKKGPQCEDRAQK